MASLSRPGSENAPQLSCDLCRERKVRCDKLNPCTNCTAAGVACSTIHRNRLPRGRHARSSAGTLGPSTTLSGHPKRRGAAAAAAAATQAANQELRERIGSLEHLIQNMRRPGSPTLTARHLTLGRQVSRKLNILLAAWS
jgi:hypothetical protein